MSYLEEARRVALGDNVEKIDGAIAAVQAQVRTIRKEIAAAGASDQAAVDAASGHAADSLVGVLLVGDGIPNGWREDATAVLNETVEKSRLLGVLASAAVDLRRKREETVASAHVAGLRWLNEALQSLLDEVRRLPAGAVPTDADTAVRGGAGSIKLYKAVQSQIAAYRDLRAAQVQLVAAARGSIAGVPQLVARAGITREPHDVDYLTKTRQLTIQPIELTNAWRFDGTAYPGVEVDPRDPLLPTTEPVLYLRWLADRGDAWVPSLVELEQADEARRIATQFFTPEPDLIGHDDFGRLPHLARLEPTTKENAA